MHSFLSDIVTYLDEKENPTEKEKELLKHTKYYKDDCIIIVWQNEDVRINYPHLNEEQQAEVLFGAQDGLENAEDGYMQLDISASNLGYDTE